VALYLSGGLKLRQEKYDEAVEALSLSAKIDPEKAQTHYLLGQALIQKGSRGPAEASLRRALQLKPAWSEAHYLLAVLYAQEPNFRELARYHYNRALSGGASRNYQLEQFMGKAAKP
jgi:Flp pilus assembly protein TadD